jgi:hemerythrin-like domain-containing protein/beta-phosphoglucomutase-like phosphatase (HAD superfamily)
MSNNSKKVEAIFFDIRDTLGIVDRKGHLVKYKPSSDQLLEAMKKIVGLRIGLITNLPDDVTRDDGINMVKEAGIWDYIDPQGFISNKESGAEKPNPQIYHFAAQQMGLTPSQCLFVGENLIEVIAAEAAGMETVLKPFPPGREFLQKPIKGQGSSEVSSGRLSEVMLEEEHVLGKRIVGAAIKITERLKAGELPPKELLRPMTTLVWLTKNFIDPFHHRKEEEVLFPFGIMGGADAKLINEMILEHDQGRHYFAGMDIALRRIQAGIVGAVSEFSHLTNGFIDLYKAHGKREDDELFKNIGDLLTDMDDAVIVDLMSRLGPADITLYLAVIASMEKDLGI